MKKLRIAIDTSDFENLATDNCVLVDKTLLIKDLMDDANRILVFPRPRRFGKTSNQSMLRYFFEKRPDGKNKGHLFHQLKIWQAGEKYQKAQGAYPVISVSLKDTKSTDFAGCLDELAHIFAKLYSYHAYLLESTVLEDQDERDYFHRIKGFRATKGDLENSLGKLCTWLYKAHQTKVILLIDEYDSPLHQAYFDGYFNEMVKFMRVLLGSVLKDNEYLEKAVVTGILRISRESLFSDLNNIKIFSLLKEPYAEYFGFTQEEVDGLLALAEASEEHEKIREWYNGFQFGQIQIYNPWSILSFLQEGEYLPYWVNTGGHGLIQETLAKSEAEVKSDFELLLAGKTISKAVDEHVVLQNINQTEERVWSFLLFSGYLKVLNKVVQGTKFLCELRIPNQEILAVYQDVISSWLPAKISSRQYNGLLSSLLMGDVKLFQKLLRETLLESLSYFDTSGKQPERFYHALVLGMLIALKETHQIQSNRESGYGRYDVMVIPKDTTQLGIVIEFKTVDTEEELSQGVEIALQQLKDKYYRQELESRGISKILELGIAFHGKHLALGVGA